MFNLFITGVGITKYTYTTKYIFFAIYFKIAHFYALSFQIWYLHDDAPL